MLRVIASLILALIVAVPTASADPGAQPAPVQKSRSTGKRVAWTVIGAAAGFGAGLFIGLNQFDDAIDSDRKVWTSALVGAAAGGVAAALVSRNVGRSPSVREQRHGAEPRADVPRVSWAEALGRTRGETPRR